MIWILCVISGLLYHLGGLGADGKKKYPCIPSWMFNTKMRDWGCALCAVGAVYIQTQALALWPTLISFLLAWGALSAYWKKSGDMQPKHWLAHGIGIGLAALPYAWCGIAWQMIVMRAIILGVTMVVVSVCTDDVRIEEIGRGALIIATVLML